MDGGHDQLPRPKPTQPTRKPKSQDPGEAYCILLVSPVGCISQNTHFRLHSKFYTEAIYKLLVVGGSGVGWGYWPAGILEAAFWSPRKHPATKPPFLQLLFFNGAMLVLVVIVGFLPSLSVVLQMLQSLTSRSTHLCAGYKDNNRRSESCSISKIHRFKFFL